jgi:diadenosine tetraphosphate (Ap4A) HIT family hydrolase
VSTLLYEGPGGTLVLPKMLFLDRADGGHLIVNPPREVWERSELTAKELTQWSFLVAATGRAMIDVLPQLEGGCVNYFEAGNWALNDKAKPAGPKTAKEHRRLHLHLFGRSRGARHPSWKWGEAPKLPDFLDRYRWAAPFEPLEAEECGAIVARAKTLLARYRSTSRPTSSGRASRRAG